MRRVTVTLVIDGPATDDDIQTGLAGLQITEGTPRFERTGEEAGHFVFDGAALIEDVEQIIWDDVPAPDPST
jgi:hypothetical protein